MKLAIRRIGNSLGVIIPRAVLEEWGVGEGGYVKLTSRGIQPAGAGGSAHAKLDELKRSLALAVVRDFTPSQIRAQILANLHRWKTQGSWVSAYDEWQSLAEQGTDGALFAAMIGRDETADRLRQSMPFVGLLSQAEVRRLNEEAAA